MVTTTTSTRQHEQLRVSTQNHVQNARHLPCFFLFGPHHAICEHTWVWIVFSCHGETNNCWHGCMKQKIERVEWKKTKPEWDMTVTKLYGNVWSDFTWTKKSMRFLWGEHCTQIYCLNPFFIAIPNAIQFQLIVFLLTSFLLYRSKTNSISVIILIFYS